VLDQQQAAQRCELVVDDLATAHALTALQFERLKRPLRNALEAGDLPMARGLLHSMARCMDARNLGQVVEYWDMQGRCLLASDQPAEAADAMRRAIETAALGELPMQRRLVLWSMASAVDLALGHDAQALDWLQQVQTASTGVQARIAQASVLTTTAWRAICSEAPDTPIRLAEAFNALASMNLVRFLRPLPRVAAQLCQRALEADVQPGFALRVIAERGLPRPADAGRQWPSPVRVLCLGPGQVLQLDGTAMVRGKGPARSLELLWWLGAHDGQPVSVQACLKALWPDAEPNAARAAFDMALARLRKLLGDQAELRLEAGNLNPDRAAFWFDTAQQRELVARLTQPGLQAGTALRMAYRLIAGYGGFFVGQADDLPWVMAARARQLARFSRGVRAAAQAQSDGAVAPIESLLRAAIEAAPTDEPLAQDLIKLHQQRGEYSLAEAVYLQLRHARSAASLPSPSGRTQALVQ
jgi:DNA-binding SARP family transcriptional activator